MAESDKFVSPVESSSGGLIGAIKRTEYKFGDLLKAVQTFADGATDALDKVQRSSRDTVNEIENTKAAFSTLEKMAPREGAGTVNASDLSAVNEILEQTTGRT